MRNNLNIHQQKNKETITYSYNELISEWEKKKELLIHKTAWINLKNITVSKRNETHKQHILHDSTV